MLKIIKKSGLNDIESIQPAVEPTQPILSREQKYFLQCIENNYIIGISECFEKGIDIHDQYEMLLFKAADNVNVPLFKKLVEHGADIHYNNNEIFYYVAHTVFQCIMSEFSSWKHPMLTEILEYLMDHGIDYQQIIKAELMNRGSVHPDKYSYALNGMIEAANKRN